jgi:hypothetical protein
MKTKQLLLGFTIVLGLSFASFAQSLPNYVPSNGLIGWWPFNGNATDQSINNLGGTSLGGVTLTTDRSGNANASYDFDYSSVSFGGQTDEVYIPYNSILNSSNISVSIWVYPRSYYWTGNPTASTIINRFQYGYSNPNGQVWGIEMNPTNLTAYILAAAPNNSQAFATVQAPTLILNTWSNIVFTYDGSSLKLYVNGVLVNSTATSILLNTAGNSGISVGESNQANGYWQPTDGKIDDIGIWNRALTQQEITSLFNSQNCNINASISTASASVNVGTNNQFTATTTDPTATFQWQTNPNNIGWQNVPNNTFYIGATTSSLTVNNVQLGNHNQPFRVIATSGNCIDTSNVAFIQIADTCINNITVYDTISVTDTLFIDINTVGLNNNAIVNTIKVFPNPSNSILNLDYGNYATLNNYRVKITNALSQIIYDQAITQQTETIDLSTFGGAGIYYLSIINPQGNVVEVRKIVLQ